jgi:glyoxylase-like metal-dependent hydrolase (beta-lactamase superfamily II)
MGKMRPTRITDAIVYLEPPLNEKFPCAGVMLTGSPTILIDANMGRRETVALLKSTDPQIAIISHYHSDHSNWGALVARHSRAELFVPEGEERYLQDFRFFVAQNVGGSALVDQWETFSRNTMRYEALKAFSNYGDLQRFTSGQVTVESIRTPGHSPSHSAFYIPSEKLLFTGDIGLGPFGPWYGWRDCNIYQFVESILRLKSLGAKTLLTSHDGIIKAGRYPVWERCLGFLVKRERRIRALLEQGLTKAEIVAGGIYFENAPPVPAPLDALRTFWDAVMFDHHKTALEKDPIENHMPKWLPSVKT